MIMVDEKKHRNVGQNFDLCIPVGGELLTIKEAKFVQNFTDPDSETYLNGKESARKSGYSDKDEKVLSSGVAQIKSRPRVKRALADRLNTQNIDDLIERGIKARLEDPEHKNWMSTADYVSKLRGDYAPEKKAVMHLTPEEREDHLESIKKLLDES